MFLYYNLIEKCVSEELFVKLSKNKADKRKSEKTETEIVLRIFEKECK